MNRFRRWLSRLRFFRHLQRRSYDDQAASEFLFERGSLVRSRVDARSAAAGQSKERATMLVVGNPAPHSATRHEEFVLRGADVPSLTITSDPSNSIAVVGTAVVRDCELQRIRRRA
jgi:hypothetical protein